MALEVNTVVFSGGGVWEKHKGFWGTSNAQFLHLGAAYMKRLLRKDFSSLQEGLAYFLVYYASVKKS